MTINAYPPKFAREVFEAAMRQTYQMVDPFAPPPAGTYARGNHEGIIAALQTVRSNFERAIAAQEAALKECVS